MLETLSVGDRVRLTYEDTPAQSQTATVCSTLSNQQEGLGPEVDDYVACWLEVSLSDCSDPESHLSVSLGADLRYSLNGRSVRIEKMTEPAGKQP